MLKCRKGKIRYNKSKTEASERTFPKLIFLPKKSGVAYALRVDIEKTEVCLRVGGIKK